jgi:hypothetical protein
VSKSDPELLRLAAKANRLASQLIGASELQRLAGRLARDPHDSDALSRAMLYQAKSDRILAEFLKAGTGLLLLQCVMERVSYLDWETLWNNAHPDRVGEAWEGEDFQLMSVWRKKVHTMIKECHQEWMLAVNDADEYIGKLLDAGASKEEATALADWLGEVRSV